MATTVDPKAALAMWADDPRYERIRVELHPSKCGALAVTDIADDALICMATLAAIISGRELLVAGDHYEHLIERAFAVADVCGFDVEVSRIKTANGNGCWAEFLDRRVPA